MLFAYQHCSHTIDHFQDFIAHLVKEVWCKPSGAFSLSKLDPDFMAIVEELENDKSVTASKLLAPIERLYELFRQKLSADQRNTVSKWFDDNNNIELLCGNDPQVVPVGYADIEAIDTELAHHLKTFFLSLWSNILGLSAVQNAVGSIDDHYRVAFLASNSEGKCPYCGYRDLLGEYSDYREAYDHYLPKTKYPFNTVNFRNLAPMCDRCNGKFKLAKDPLRRNSNGSRRKAFYSYGSQHPKIDIRAEIVGDLTGGVKPANINLDFRCDGYEEEVETWLDLFKIVDRYKAKCCYKNEGTAWLERINIESITHGISPRRMFEIEVAIARNKPWADSNFLKAPFLEACDRAKLVR
jgi:hypothetical protein